MLKRFLLLGFCACYSAGVWGKDPEKDPNKTPQQSIKKFEQQVNAVVKELSYALKTLPLIRTVVEKNISKKNAEEAEKKAKQTETSQVSIAVKPVVIPKTRIDLQAPTTTEFKSMPTVEEMNRDYWNRFVQPIQNIVQELKTSEMSILPVDKRVKTAYPLVSCYDGELRCLSLPTIEGKSHTESVAILKSWYEVYTNPLHKEFYAYLKLSEKERASKPFDLGLPTEIVQKVKTETGYRVQLKSEADELPPLFSLGNGVVEKVNQSTATHLYNIHVIHFLNGEFIVRHIYTEVEEANAVQGQMLSKGALIAHTKNVHVEIQVQKADKAITYIDLHHKDFEDGLFVIPSNALAEWEKYTHVYTPPVIVEAQKDKKEELPIEVVENKVVLKKSKTNPELLSHNFGTVKVSYYGGDDGFNEYDFTACGERYNMNECCSASSICQKPDMKYTKDEKNFIEESFKNINIYTAANTTLPFGSIVKLTNVENGKTVFVRITDAGPYVGNRKYDVNLAAAKALGLAFTNGKKAMGIADCEAKLMFLSHRAIRKHKK